MITNPANTTWGPFEIAMNAIAVTAVVRMDLKHTIHCDGPGELYLLF